MGSQVFYSHPGPFKAIPKVFASAQQKSPWGTKHLAAHHSCFLEYYHKVFGNGKKTTSKK